MQLALGAVSDAAASFGAALAVNGKHPAALLGMAQALLASARAAASIGAVGELTALISFWARDTSSRTKASVVFTQVYDKV